MSVEYITGGGKERLPAAVALHGEVFKTDPVIQFLLHTIPSPERENYIPIFIGTLLKAAALSGGSIWDEAWTTSNRPSEETPPACSAVWLGPGCKVDNWKNYYAAGFFPMAWNVGFSGLRRMLGGFQSSSDKAKKEGLRNPDGSKIKRFYYLFFISTAPEERGKGLSSELIRRFQDKATQEGLPIWLESTTARSHRLYQKLGFKDMRNWILGKGEVDENGFSKKGGAGVPVWAMLWQPDEKKG
jgi:GNAT superfamily N-acetyltransferase